MNIGSLSLRWVVFMGVLGLTLLPGLIVDALVVELPGFLGLAGYAWLWKIVATLPAGITGPALNGRVLFADTSALVALVFWLLVGLAASAALHRLRLAWFAVASMAVIVASGIGAHLLLAAFGYGMTMNP